MSSAWTDTNVSQVQISFRWTLHGASRLLMPTKSDSVLVRNLTALRSPNFFSDADADTQWYLEVQPRGQDDDDAAARDHLSVHLTLDCSPQSQVVATYEFSLVTSAGDTQHTFREESARFVEGQRRGKDQFVRRNLLFERGRSLCPGDALTIDCQVSATRVVHAARQTAAKSGDRLDPTTHSAQLSDDLVALLGDVRFSDVVLHAGGHRFAAHRAVLAARSPVLAKLLERRTLEHPQRLEITDVAPDIMQLTLKYIYSGRVEQLESSAAGLLAVADRYALDRLKRSCQERLMADLNAANAGSMYMLADVHSAEQLKASALKLMQRQQGGLAALVAAKR